MSDCRSSGAIGNDEHRKAVSDCVWSWKLVKAKASSGGKLLSAHVIISFRSSLMRLNVAFILRLPFSGRNSSTRLTDPFR